MDRHLGKLILLAALEGGVGAWHRPQPTLNQSYCPTKPTNRGEVGSPSKAKRKAQKKSRKRNRK